MIRKKFFFEVHSKYIGLIPWELKTYQQIGIRGMQTRIAI